MLWWVAGMGLEGSAWAVTPRRGRFVAYRGNVLHGVIPPPPCAPGYVKRLTILATSKDKRRFRLGGKQKRTCVTALYYACRGGGGTPAGDERRLTFVILWWGPDDPHSEHPANTNIRCETHKRGTKRSRCDGEERNDNTTTTATTVPTTTTTGSDEAAGRPHLPGVEMENTERRAEHVDAVETRVLPTRAVGWTHEEEVVPNTELMVREATTSHLADGTREREGSERHLGPSMPHPDALDSVQWPACFPRVQLPSQETKLPTTKVYFLQGRSTIKLLAPPILEAVEIYWQLSKKGAPGASGS
eukprot:1194339-Prorocentrum_minimum.AAC.2